MLIVQVSNNLNNVPFILDGSLPLTQKDAIIFQDGGRAAPLVAFTLMAKISATGKWVPFTDETAVDGTSQPRGVYMGPDIPAADLVAGDVEDSEILVGGGVVLDKARIVIENAKTLGTVIGAATVPNKTVEDALNELGIFLGDTDSTTGFQNP